MTEVLSREEIAQLTQASDGRGALSMAVTAGLIAGAFALVALWPSWLTVLVALVILGGRQLGLAVLMHETAHRSLFRTRWLNEVLGRWLFGAPIWTDMQRYRRHHLGHHAFTGTERDPDLVLVTPFPTTRASLARKLLRDVLGLTGLKRIFGLVLMDFGVVSYSASGDVKRQHKPLMEHLAEGARNLTPVMVSNGVLWLLLWSLGHGWLYLLWVGAYLTTFSLFMRIRSLAEHACTAETADVFRNTRTTQVGWLARLTVAPHDVGYHLEHHLLMTVPHYKLAQMRRTLRERGALERAPEAAGYLQVLRLVSSKG